MYSTVTDNVTVGGITISQPICAANQSKGLFFDGIMGLGPDDLATGFVVGEPDTTIPTITDVSNHYVTDFSFADNDFLEYGCARKSRVCFGRNVLTSIKLGW